MREKDGDYDGGGIRVRKLSLLPSFLRPRFYVLVFSVIMLNSQLRANYEAQEIKWRELLTEREEVQIEVCGVTSERKNVGCICARFYLNCEDTHLFSIGPERGGLK